MGIPDRQMRLVDRYIEAKGIVIGKGFGAEISWQNDILFENVTASHFLREVAWVVLSSGMREAVIRKKFRAISNAFYDWEDVPLIILNSGECRARALATFGHQKKVDAIIKIVTQVHTEGYDLFKEHILNSGIEFIRTLPFMGPATSYHLAKNIGLDVVKPDRHLMRITSALGYESPKQLCDVIADTVGDRVGVVDLVIWRFATLHNNYVELFST